MNKKLGKRSKKRAERASRPSAGVNNQANFVEEARKLQTEIEQLSLRVRDLVLIQSPLQLLGYLWSQFHVGILSGMRGNEEGYRPDTDLIQTYQFALEYAHAVWSCDGNWAAPDLPFNEIKAGELLQTLESLRAKTMLYCMASSAANSEPEGSRQSAQTEFHAKTSWYLIRGNRYQVLEEEFFTFVLTPHSDALEKVYGMSAVQIAAGIQDMANSVRTGVGDAVEKISEAMAKADALKTKTGEELEAAIQSIADKDTKFTADMAGATQDIFFGGIGNLSRHSDFSPALLEDFSYVPGENQEFFGEGEFVGTPMRTFPARIKPGIKLGDDYYLPDAAFGRDAAYRVIQRGLLARMPEYREEWNHRQKVLSEDAFPTILSSQLEQAQKFGEVYFQDVVTGEWCETDLVLVIDDNILVVEAKAGVGAMQSPAMNFRAFERAIQGLIIKAYAQCKRFVEYLYSAPEVKLYNRINNEYVEICRLKHETYRKVLPIGLTVEAFTPFSAMSKELTEMPPICGRHPFISMSIDDLFVLDRFLQSTGEFLHYLDVRQGVAGIKNALVFDEIDHLGAYITDNRFDMRLKEQLEKVDMITVSGTSEVIDRHFEGDSWATDPITGQKYPQAIQSILTALDRDRPKGWLQFDARLRDLGDEGRRNVSNAILNLQGSLGEFFTRRLLLTEDEPLLILVSRSGVELNSEETLRRAQISCLSASAAKVFVLKIWYNPLGQITRTACETYKAPSILQANYVDLQREAVRERSRLINLQDI